ncbi:hypothetical protein GCM10009557_95810 [Virgisporangium ochraceum]
MTADPPLLAGGVNATLAEASPRVPVTPVGAPGTAAGVTLVLAADAAEVPVALVAVTVNVYGVPFVRPVTTHGLAEQDAVSPPGLEVVV